MRVSGSAAGSDTGRKRRHNEDSYVSDPPVFAVADGMGGAQAGEVASQLAAETVAELLIDPAESGEQRVVSLIKAANNRVYQRARADAAASGMGTTMTVALVQADGNIAIGHVGDSRAYVLRGGRLEQLTEDHSLVAELSAAEAAVHPQRAVITRALGTESDVDVDAFTVTAEDGDVFLLCSDGLTTMVDVTTIGQILEEHRASLDSAPPALIKAANDRGGDDNITAIVFGVAAGEPVRAEEAAPPAPPAADPDDEDTLHPEDRVMLPPELTQESTVRLPAVIEPGLETGLESQSNADPGPVGEGTMVLSAHELAAAMDRPGERPPGPGFTGYGLPDPGTLAAGYGLTGEVLPEETVSIPRLILALLVIAALIAMILLLILDALPR